MEGLMKKYLWIGALLLALPGCLNQTHYNEVMGTVDDVKALKQHDQEQDRRLDRLEKTLNDLRSGLKPEIRDQGVKVEGVRKSTSEDGMAGSLAAVKVTMPQPLLFPKGSIQISPGGRAVLAKVAKELRNTPENGLIRIVGHTDALPVGERLRARFADNWELSAARAAAVARVFIWGEGLDKHRIRVEGRGAEEPVADNATPEGRAKNRRIELFIEQAAD